MSESNRHHYLPRFYIKNFCNEKHELFVKDLNDTNENKIKKRVPKNAFFEWDRNNHIINGEVSDVIEKIYSDLDNSLSPSVARLLDHEAVAGNTLEVKTLRELIFLGHLIKWRVPKNDIHIGRLSVKTSFSDMNLYATLGENVLQVEDIVEENVGKDLKRILFSSALFRNESEYAKVFKDCFIISFPKPLLISDSPFVELSTEAENEYPSFIFPISSHLLLVYSSSIDKYEFAKVIQGVRYPSYQEYLFNSIQMTQMLHAYRFIACEEKEHLQHYLKKIPEVAQQIEARDGIPANMAFTALNEYHNYIQKWISTQ